MRSAREWVSEERPSVLFDLVLRWLLDHNVVLPGSTTLERIIARVRDRVAERVFQRISQIPTPDQRSRLERLLERSGASRIAMLERLPRAQQGRGKRRSDGTYTSSAQGCNPANESERWVKFE
jgi:hypothetical protein